MATALARHSVKIQATASAMTHSALGGVCATLVKAWIAGVKVGLGSNFLRPRQGLGKALVVYDLSFAEEFYGVADVGIVDEPQKVVVGHTRLLLC